MVATVARTGRMNPEPGGGERTVRCIFRSLGDASDATDANASLALGSAQYITVFRLSDLGGGLRPFRLSSDQGWGLRTGKGRLRNRKCKERGQLDESRMQLATLSCLGVPLFIEDFCAGLGVDPSVLCISASSYRALTRRSVCQPSVFPWRIRVEGKGRNDVTSH